MARSGTNGNASNGSTKRKTRRLPALPLLLSKTRPTLIVIGGREDKIGDALILREVARHVGNGKLVVAAVASNEPESLFREYDQVFRKLGIKRVENLKVRSREDAADP